MATKQPKTKFAGGENIFTGESSKIDPDKIASVQMSGSAPGAAAKPATTPEATP
jgi:hypothetical protein